jgi:ribosomal protein L30/L7E
MSGKIKVTLVTKINRTVELEDTPAIRGMVFKVSHLVRTEEANDAAE